MRRLTLTAAAIVAAALLLSGCSGTRLYKADLPHNLKVLPKTESVKAALDIFSVDRQCQASYQGTVELDNKPLELGLPADKTAYLVVSFASSSFWRSSSSHMNHDALLRTRKGYRYELNVSYIDDIYNVMLYEINAHSGKRRELEMAALNECHQR